MTGATALTLTGLTKRFGSTQAVTDFSIEVRPGELVTLVGPSGSGKTTVLRIVAGFVPPDEGRVFAGNDEITHLVPERRDIGMVFQSYALFPHMDVRANISFGLDRRRIASNEKQRRVDAIVELVNLRGLERRYPGQLSGGQRQRVALARALVIEPRLLLLDEPLSNLDAQLRERLREKIRAIQRRVGITTVLVTHDQEEALSVSDRVAVIHQGRLHQFATPQKLYDYPVDEFVAGFIGKMNWLNLGELAVTDEGRVAGRLASGEAVSGRAQTRPLPSSKGRLALRPEALHLGATPNGERVNALEATLDKRSFLGDREIWNLRLSDGTPLQTSVPAGTETSPHRSTEAGERVRLWWRPDAGVVFFDPS